MRNTRRSRRLGLGILCLTLSAAGLKPQHGLITATESCQEIPGSELLLGPGNVVLLGEIHGTVNIPEFFGDLVCVAMDRGLDVSVVLEIDLEEQDRLDRYLSAGDDVEPAALLAGPFWQSGYQDGRRSRAMFRLIDRLRQYRAESGYLPVAAMDRREHPSTQAREEFMARRVEEAAQARPEAVVLVLTGNIHSRMVPGTPWDSTFIPLGALVQSLLAERRVLGLNATHPGGSAWICASGSGCGPSPLTGTGQITEESSIRLTPEAESYDGLYSVGPLVASPPARDVTADELLREEMSLPERQ